MNKQAVLEEVRQAAFEDELEKVALSTGAVYRATANRSLSVMENIG